MFRFLWRIVANRRLIAAWFLAVATATLAMAEGTGPELVAPMPSAAPSMDLPLTESPWPNQDMMADASDASPLPAAMQNEKRSVQLEQVAQQADRRTRHGYELASRGAYFAARSEFLGALRLVAEGLDTERKTNRHSRALAKAIGALKEAEDFLPNETRLEADVDVAHLISIHDTPVLKEGSDVLTPLEALRSYLTFAQEQFAVAVENEVAGSMALHALGKLHAAMSQKKAAMIAAPESKAIVYYQASLLAYRDNAMAANDLGVLLAQGGRFADAQKMLQQSLALNPQSTGWRNLSVVYSQLGQTALAHQAARQADACRKQELAQHQTTPISGNGTVQWLDPQTFAANSRNTLNPSDPAPVQKTPTAQPALTGNPKPPTPPSSAERMAWGARTASPTWTNEPTAKPTVPNQPTAIPRTPSSAERMTWGSRGATNSYR